MSNQWAESNRKLSTASNEKRRFFNFQGSLGRGLALSLVLCSFGLAEAQAPEPWAPGYILVKPRAGLPQAALDHIVKVHGGRDLGRIRALDVRKVSVPAQAEDAVAKALSRNPHIKFAEKDMLVPSVQVTPNDPMFNDAWHLQKIDAPNAWDNAQGAGITIAVLDTGVNSSHPDLSAKMLSGWNAVDGSGDTDDVHGHGTAVAGTVAAITDNAIGVASVARDAMILPVRVTNRTDGYAYFSDIANGLTWAADNGANVANISFSVSGSSTVTNAAQYMKQLGGLVVAAAGNDGADTGLSDNPSIVTVSSTTSSDGKASTSNYGDFVDVGAPGESILTTTSSGGYGYWSGTSFASPVTAGVAALIMSADLGLTADEVEQILEQSADDLVSGFDWHPYYGNGRVNASAAVAMALNITPPPVDTEAPIVTIFDPVNGATVAGLVSIEVSASDDIAVSEVRLYAAGNLVAVDSVAPYQFSWDSTQATNGNVILTAYAYDAQDNEGVSNAVTVSVDNAPDSTPPVVEILSPADSSTVSRTVQILVQASDEQGIDSIELYIDGQLKASVATGELTYSWNTRKASSGGHTIEAIAGDAAGNSSQTSVQVTIGGSSGGKGGKKK